jgi:hypothetical protein
VSFRLGAAAGAGTSSPGEIDYRLARRARIDDYRRGRLARHDVCDAQPELLRNAELCSKRTSRRCPICDERRLVLVTYVFGPRLPASGRCITSQAELARLAARRQGSYAAYEVEVCTGCRWNHLARTYLLNPVAS